MDKEGKSVVHLAVSPVPLGSFESVQMLRLLHSHGADLNGVDAAGRAPLHYAKQQTSGVMQACLLSLGAEEVPPPMQRQASGIFVWPSQGVACEEDAARRLEQLRAEGTDQKKHKPPSINKNIDAANGQP